ncbi:MAG: glycoside hydrolase family 9 protein [bacterium]
MSDSLNVNYSVEQKCCSSLLKNFNILISWLLLSLFAITNSYAGTVNPIKVDQFGYLPNAQKIAVISDPQQGFNAADDFIPASTYEVRRVDNNNIAYQGSLTTWQYEDSFIHKASGDKVWWFDFSNLTESGEYYIYDAQNNRRSENFRIDEKVYQDVMKQAVRSFYYQRANFAKQPPYADTRWADGASHSSTKRALLLDWGNPLNGDSSTKRDLSGGWYDAGDYNKYINYADGAVHELLLAYEENPSVWGDDYNLPESGNGVPDLLDEVKWELDWFLKMQNADGSVLHKLSALNFGGETSPPSTDGNGDYNESCADDSQEKYQCDQHFYAPATASATISAAAVFAHAANVYQSLNDTTMQQYADTLTAAAEKAWQWLRHNPQSIPSNYGLDLANVTEIETGFATPHAEDCPERSVWNDNGTLDYQYFDCNMQLGNQVIAAVYLYALTNKDNYHTFIKENAVNNSRLLQENSSERYLRSDGQYEEFQNGLLYYAALPNADSTLAATIRENFYSGLQRNHVDYAPLKFAALKADAYRAHIDGYSWGSNRKVANSGNALMNVINYQVATNDDDLYKNAASGYLHYLHGVNPLNMTYLTNMQDFGADNSVTELYHAWFDDGTAWDSVNDSHGPASGFLVGGANAFYGIGGIYMDDVQSDTHLVNKQPAQKRFISSNSPYFATYYLTENSITYQAPYIRLLSKFLADANSDNGQNDNTNNGDNQNDEGNSQADNIIKPSVAINVTSQWDDGYCADINITPAESINHWELTLQLPDENTGIWSVEKTEIAENRFLIKPLVWNHLIFENQTKGFSLCGKGNPNDITISQEKAYTYPTQQAKDFDSLRVDMWISGLWYNNYCMKVNITNRTNDIIEWQEVRLALPDSTLDEGWSGNFTMDNNELVINPLSWNKNLGIGEDTTVTFCATGYNNVSILAANTQ